jgi:uncharacterized membrane protein
MSTSMAIELTLHLLATAAMAGLIWFVQVVHYPLFAAVGLNEFSAYENKHQRLTSFVVGPLMAVEGVTAVLLAIAPPAGISRVLPLMGLALLAVIHASTVLLQVPQHTALASGYDQRRVQRLVKTNWIRTVGWSLRGIVALVMIVQVLKP